MSLCTVAELRSVLGIGALYTDAQLQEVCDAADRVLLPMLWTGGVQNIGQSVLDDVVTLYFQDPVPTRFYVGMTINVEGNGPHLNGVHTVTEHGPDYVKYVLAAPHEDRVYHDVLPHGIVHPEEHSNWDEDPSIQLAAQFIAVDIWQARNSAGMGGVGIDGSPIPYRLNTQLLSKVRGLIAHALDPGGMVG